MSSLHPYLTFDSNCHEAFEFYQKVFGGEFTPMTTFSENTFWIALFGMFMDKFGIQWMVNCDFGEKPKNNI